MDHLFGRVSCHLTISCSFVVVVVKERFSPLYLVAVKPSPSTIKLAMKKKIDSSSGGSSSKRMRLAQSKHSILDIVSLLPQALEGSVRPRVDHPVLMGPTMTMIEACAKPRL